MSENIKESEYSIVRKISEQQKLGNDGKLDSFIGKVIKNLTREVAVLEKNKETLTFNHQQRMDDFKDKIEDATEAEANSYTAINVKEITTNEAQNHYIETYLTNIERNGSAVKSIEEVQKSSVEIYDEKIKVLDESIATLKRRITTISAK